MCVYPGVSPGFVFLQSRAAGRALGVVQRPSRGWKRCLLCSAGGGRGEMQIAAADRGRARTGECCEGMGTSEAQLSPSAPARALPRLQPDTRKRLYRTACWQQGLHNGGFPPTFRGQIVPLIGPGI